MKKVEDFTKEERKIYDRGRHEWWEVSDEIQGSVNDIYEKGYKMGYRDGKLGRKRIPHNTANGWCCACDYDIGLLEDKLKKSKY